MLLCVPGRHRKGGFARHYCHEGALGAHLMFYIQYFY